MRRAAAARDLPGNLGGIHLARFGEARVQRSTSIPFPWMNMVRTIRSNDLDALAPIPDYFQGASFFAETTAPELTPELADLLTGWGLRPERMDTILYGLPGLPGADPEVALRDGPLVHEVGTAEAGLVQSLYVDGFEFPTADREFARDYLPAGSKTPTTVCSSPSSMRRRPRWACFGSTTASPIWLAAPPSPRNATAVARRRYSAIAASWPPRWAANCLSAARASQRARSTTWSDSGFVSPVRSCIGRQRASAAFPSPPAPVPYA